MNPFFLLLVPRHLGVNVFLVGSEEEEPLEEENINTQYKLDKDATSRVLNYHIGEGTLPMVTPPLPTPSPHTLHSLIACDAPACLSPSPKVAFPPTSFSHLIFTRPFKHW